MRLLRNPLGRMARRAVVGPVEFCERCGKVCDARCRAEALRDQARTRALTAGWPGPR